VSALSGSRGKRYITDEGSLMNSSYSIILSNQIIAGYYLVNLIIVTWYYLAQLILKISADRSHRSNLET
jgi:hypothetical protein